LSEKVADIEYYEDSELSKKLKINNAGNPEIKFDDVVFAGEHDSKTIFAFNPTKHSFMIDTIDSLDPDMKVISEGSMIAPENAFKITVKFSSKKNRIEALSTILKIKGYFVVMPR
jgi:hypothetical protein